MRTIYIYRIDKFSSISLLKKLLTLQLTTKLTYVAAVVKSPQSSVPEEFWDAEEVWFVHESAGWDEKSNSRSLLEDEFIGGSEIDFAGVWDGIACTWLDAGGGGNLTPPGGGGNRPGVPPIELVFGRGFELPAFF